MRTLGTLVFFLFLLATCWLLANRTNHRSKLLNGPLALAILIGLQAVLLNLLSPWCAVSALSLLLGNTMFIAAVIYAECSRLGARGLAREYGVLVKSQAELWSGRTNPLALLVAPLLVILLFTAFVYPPNTWDSMTYHMARVVYWMQNGSISYFPTSISRQNQMNPGAEYVILLLQSLSGADFLANFVQFVSYYLLVSAIPSFLRLLGIQRQVANWGLVLAASLPMGVLQATSTQNDLVASCLGLALAAAALRFWHTNAPGRSSRSDLVVVALLGATAFLVKPTAVLAAAPFLLVAAVSFCRAVMRCRRCWRSQALNLLLGALVVAVIAGPDLYRKKVHTGSFAAARPEVYPLIGYWRNRIIHSVEGMSFHFIPVEVFYRNVTLPTSRLLNGGNFSIPRTQFSTHEDDAGNPFHMLFAATAFVVFVFRYRRIPRAGRCAVWCVGGAWLLLHATVCFQFWISRLQTPVFLLFPCLLAAWATRSRLRSNKHGLAVVLFAFGLTCISYGIVTAARNPSRYVQVTDLWQIDRDSEYYHNRHMKASHDRAIATMKELNVHKVGLYIGPDDYDYPLSWRLYRLGMEVRHMVDELDLAWADAVYAPGDLPAGSQSWARQGTVVINPTFLK